MNFMVNKLRIAHIGPFLEHRITGPKNSVTMLSKALSECNDFVSNVYTFSSSEDFNFNGVAIKSIEKFNLSCYDIVVFPGLFGLAYYKLGKILKKKNIPYVVSP